MTDLINNLKSNSLKVTPQRLAIYSYLASTKEHPSAEQIYTSLREEYPNMSLATVYKTVASLRDAGLVMELNVGEDNFRYDACVKPHGHVVCRRCHRVVDYMGRCISPGTVSEVEAATGCQVENTQVYFFGTCEDCRE